MDGCVPAVWKSGVGGWMSWFSLGTARSDAAGGMRKRNASDYTHDRAAHKPVQFSKG